MLLNTANTETIGTTALAPTTGVKAITSTNAPPNPPKPLIRDARKAAPASKA